MDNEPIISHWITSTASKLAVPRSGRVSLVGAGPGDAELLTVKALRCLQNAEVIIYDRLVSEAICALFPPTALALYVGKAKGEHSVPQESINDLLVEKARLGLNVCRLKGGDAFVFGRGGEEMLALKQAGIDVEVIPGITAAAGCTAYAGIPLTHRGLSQGCTFVTAHAEKELDIHWQSLAQLNHTLVFYMGLSKSQLISDELMAAGQSGNTPAAIIEHGCSSRQRVIQGQLNTLSQLVAKHQLQSPSLIVVGEVVSLADQLAWFNTQAKPTALSEQTLVEPMTKMQKRA
jgi:uroporphyrin-III C-methyltransferase